jgi:hypothetical protein
MNRMGLRTAYAQRTCRPKARRSHQASLLRTVGRFVAAEQEHIASTYDAVNFTP